MLERSYQDTIHNGDWVHTVERQTYLRFDDCFIGGDLVFDMTQVGDTYDFTVIVNECKIAGRIVFCLRRRDDFRRGSQSGRLRFQLTDNDFFGGSITEHNYIEAVVGMERYALVDKLKRLHEDEF